ncbi:hypothetical protein [Pseudomonas fluorescens]|uniref:hypothetical protein n=1 Tax=Pseudomonas fluorescens TaxID=294 RepID=UPI00123F83F0|nr:hypothetical protein [Pseudomonas fluorescens]
MNFMLLIAQFISCDEKCLTVTGPSRVRRRLHQRRSAVMCALPNGTEVTVSEFRKLERIKQ